MSNDKIPETHSTVDAEVIANQTVNFKIASQASQKKASVNGKEQTDDVDIEAGKQSLDSSGNEERGWNNVKKRLGTLVAVKAVMDTQKRPRVRKPVGQRDFLEKFSTREYHPVRSVKRSSVSNAARRVSVVINTPHNKPVGYRDSVKNNNALGEQHELNEIKPKETVVVDNSCVNDDIEDEKVEFKCKEILMTFTEPYSTFLYCWLYIVNLAIGYNAWVIFLRIAFSDAQKQFQTVWFTLDYIADFIYVFDIIICTRTSFLEDGIYVDDLRRMAQAYLKSYQFALDFTSVLPLDLIYFAVGTNPALRLPRMLKYYKTFVSQKTILALTTYPNVLRTCIFLHLMLIMMHWNACFYFLISKYEGFGVNGWVYPKFNSRTASLSYQYALCFYWSTLSLTTIGGSAHPETTIECAFMIVCYCVGIFIFASIVGQAGNVIQNMSASRIDFEKQRDASMQYMKRHNVPQDMQRRVRLWYDYSYSRGRFQGGMDINDMLLLPNKMKTELALHVHLETLRRVSFLQKCQPEFLHDLVLKMKMIIFTPGDYVCRKGEVAREMYVISDGILEVISETGRVLKVLRSGDFFGEIGILSLSKGQNRRTADVKAYGYVELFVLSKDDVLNAIKEYPNAQKILAKHGRNRLKQDNSRKDGPRDDTTSESDDEVGSMLMNINSSTGLSDANDVKGSPDSRRSSFRRGSIRRDNDSRRSNSLRVPTPAESDPNALPIPDKFSSNKGVVHDAMMSVINPLVKPASNAIASVRSPSLQEKRKSFSSVLVNNDAINADNISVGKDIEKEKLCEARKPVKASLETEKIIKFIQTSQEELLINMKSIFKKKLAKSQRGLCERIEELEQAICEKSKEIQDLKNLLRNEKVKKSLQEESQENNTEMTSFEEKDSVSTPCSPHKVEVPLTVVCRERSKTEPSIPEVSSA